MSLENVELLRDMYGRATLSEFVESLHPQAELHQASVMPDTDDYFGRKSSCGARSFGMRNGSRLPDRPLEFRDIGERVLIRVRLSGRGRSSGVELDLTLFHLWTYRENTPWRCEVFVDEANALEAAGLRE